LIPVVNRPWQGSHIRQVCIVADWGMVSQDIITELEQQSWPRVSGRRGCAN
jgi:hypothetical protein